MEHGEHMEHGEAAAAAVAYNVNLQCDPPAPVAGQPCALSLVVSEQALGEPLRDFEPLHDRLLHLILVHDSLRHFAHLHPVLKDGVFRVSHVFPEAGSYKLWAETRPRGAQSVLAAFRLTVSGDRGETAEADGLEGHAIDLQTTPLVAHADVALAFRVSMAGQPVRDLEPLMAAGGHCVVISGDLRDFLHVHPTEDVPAGWRGGPEVSFHTAFHRPGRYKAWGQFQHQGRVLTGGFDLDVGEAHHH